MKILRRCVLPVLVLQLLLCAPAAMAASDVVASGSCGKNVTWELDSQGTLTISGKGEMDDHTVYCGPPFIGVTGQIKRAIIGEGVTRIGNYVFYDCNAMTSISIPTTVTSIGAYAFEACSSLDGVELPAGLTVLEEGAFRKCAFLTEITIPKGITTIENSVFCDNTGLTSVTLPAGLQTIGERAFFECARLTEVTIPKSVTSIGQYAFAWCRGLESIYFQGSAPRIGDGCFWDVKADVSYPMDDSTWTDAVRQDYDGTLNWVSVRLECPHADIRVENGQESTCEQDGYSGDTYCRYCGISLEQGYILPKTGHSWTEGGWCAVCGASQDAPLRLAGAHRYETAFQAADQMKQVLGVEKFDTVVVASGTDFADALSGSYLAAVKKAPILLGCNVAWINDLVKDYIRENLNPGGMVYILGGEKAIGASFAEGLEDFAVQRLAGDNRFLTNLLVLEEAGVGDTPILVCTGLNFADSLSASATKLPILLVYGNRLLDGQAAFLEANRGCPLYIIGGTGAVSQVIEAQLMDYGTPQRLAGEDRFQTSVRIAQAFFRSPTSVVLAYAWDFPDGLCGGPLAAAMNAPLLLTMSRYEDEAMAYANDQKIRSGIVLGGEKLLPETTVRAVFNLLYQ